MAIPSLDASLDKMRQTLDSLLEDGEKIGSMSDGAVLRDRIQSNAKELVQLSASVKKQIMTLKEDDDPSISQYENDFMELSKQMKEKLPSILNRLKQNKTETSSTSQVTPVVSQPLLEQQTVDNETQQIEDLEVSVREILSTMTELNRIFNQTLEELQKQRNTLLTLDNTISNAHDDVKGGNEQLEKATEHQKGSTRCLCWLLLVVGIIVAGIAIFLFIHFSGKSKNTPTPTPAPSTSPQALLQALHFIE